MHAQSASGAPPSWPDAPPSSLLPRCVQATIGDCCASCAATSGCNAWRYCSQKGGCAVPETTGLTNYKYGYCQLLTSAEVAAGQPPAFINWDAVSAWGGGGRNRLASNSPTRRMACKQVPLLQCSMHAPGTTLACRPPSNQPPPSVAPLSSAAGDRAPRLRLHPSWRDPRRRGGSPVGGPHCACDAGAGCGAVLFVGPRPSGCGAGRRRQRRPQALLSGWLPP